jgi:hypothetical protein
LLGIFKPQVENFEKEVEEDPEEHICCELYTFDIDIESPDAENKPDSNGSY